VEREPAPDLLAPTVAPFVSVVLPCWNNAATIERALASALELRSVPLEVIVIDDGSTDGTPEIVRRIAAADPRLRLEVLPDNGGVSVARNRGLELVRGEWLTLLDADDAFAPGGLERLVSAAQAGDALAVIGQQVWTDGSRRWIGRLYDVPAIRTPGRKSIASQPELMYFVSPHAKIVHRTAWQGLRFDGRLLGDQAWVIRSLLRAGERVDVLGDTVYEWSRPKTGRAGSITDQTRSSAALGVAAAVVAGHAFEAVAAEAAATLDEPSRNLVLVTYVERLLRSDLGVHLRQALERRDASIAELIDAIAGFVAAIPAPLVRGSDALAVDIVTAIRAQWHRVNHAGRAAYDRLVAAALAADPKLATRPHGWRQRFGLRLSLRLPRGVAGPIAELVLFGTGVPERAWRQVVAAARRFGPRRAAVPGVR
jgi:hypothetical protein